MILDPAEIQVRMVRGVALVLVLAVVGLSVHLSGGAPVALRAVLGTLVGDAADRPAPHPAQPVEVAPEAQNLHYRTVFTEIGRNRPRPRPRTPAASLDAAPLLRPTF